MKQHRGDFGEITKENLEAGDTLAMLDRNCIREEFVRRVFVLAATEEIVIVFDEHGQPIDEPGNFVEGGWQQLHGDHSFMEEWTGSDDGYYQLGVPEAPAPAPADLPPPLLNPLPPLPPPSPPPSPPSRTEMCAFKRALR